MGQRGRPVRGADALSVFCYQLALMIRSGIHPEEAVGILAADAPPADKPLLEAVHRELRDGRPLSEALARSGGFPGYLVHMVEIGQAAGRLDQVLSALSSYYRRQAETDGALRRAVVYPAVMAVLVAAVFLILVWRVLPVFQQVYDQLGVASSPAARTLLRAGSVSKYVGAILVLCLAAAAVALLALLRSGAGAAMTRRLIGPSAGLAVDRSRFSSAMSLMLSSGIALDEAMERTCVLLESSALAPRLTRCRERMEGGLSFPRAVEETGVLDGLQAGLLGAGFRSGVPEQAMGELSQRCQEEADGRLERRLSRFEFGLVLLLCLVVGLVLLSVMLPLLGVLSAIG